VKPRSVVGVAGTCMMLHSSNRWCQCRILIFQSEGLLILHNIPGTYGERSKLCPNCMLSNHSQEECALSQLTNSKPSGRKEWEREEMPGGDARRTLRA